MNDKQFEEKVREVWNEIFPVKFDLARDIDNKYLVQFAKYFYELGEMG